MGVNAILRSAYSNQRSKSNQVRGRAKAGANIIKLQPFSHNYKIQLFLEESVTIYR
jgi:hypothetical protein